MIISTFTVFFEDPFWIGIAEVHEENVYAALKITFGAEPRENELYDWVLTNWNRLRFSRAIQTESICEKKPNPKRMHRQIRKQLACDMPRCTKAQQALQQEYEQRKSERKMQSRLQKQEEKNKQFQLRCRKKKEKHKGH